VTGGVHGDDRATVAGEVIGGGGLLFLRGGAREVRRA
jgi:hypothetical protein